MAVYNESFMINEGRIDEFRDKRKAMKNAAALAKMESLKLATKCVKEVVSNSEYKKSKLPAPDFIDYLGDDDFKKVYSDWYSNKSKVITICTFSRDCDYKAAFELIKDNYMNKTANKNKLIVGKLQLSDKYGSTINLNFKM